MPIINNNPHTSIAVTVLRDKRISLGARGLFCYIYSSEPDTEISSHSLADTLSEGKIQIEDWLQELEFYGYLKYSAKGWEVFPNA